MQTITSTEKLAHLVDNNIDGNLELVNSKITFKNHSNLFFASGEKPINLINSVIEFTGQNALVYLSPSRYKFRIRLSIGSNCVCFIGENFFHSSQVRIVCFENHNILIGDDCLFSVGVDIRNTDSHAIYNASTYKRINNAKSIFVGDHVWVGRNSQLLKGTSVGSGSIIGASSVVAGKKIRSNSVWGGNPAKKYKRGYSSLKKQLQKCQQSDLVK
jgi:acetyltransferase-like isoleucine patch superfamily enzyme